MGKDQIIHIGCVAAFLFLAWFFQDQSGYPFWEVLGWTMIFGMGFIVGAVYQVVYKWIPPEVEEEKE